MEFVSNYIFKTAVIGIVCYLVTFTRTQNKRYKATMDGTQAILKDRLISSIHKAKKQGYLYVFELENINNMYVNYRNLCGNGAIVHMMKEVENLPTKTNIN